MTAALLALTLLGCGSEHLDAGVEAYDAGDLPAADALRALSSPFGRARSRPRLARAFCARVRCWATA